MFEAQAKGRDCFCIQIAKETQTVAFNNLTTIIRQSPFLWMLLTLKLTNIYK